jgi:hypothetical protein
MDSSAEKYIKEFLPQPDGSKDQGSNQLQLTPYSKIQPSGSTASPNLTAEMAEHPSLELKKSSSQLTANNLAILNQQSSSTVQTPQSACSDAGTHGGNSVLSQESQVFQPPSSDKAGQLHPRLSSDIKNMKALGSCDITEMYPCVSDW